MTIDKQRLRELAENWPTESTYGPEIGRLLDQWAFCDDGFEEGQLLSQILAAVDMRARREVNGLREATEGPSAADDEARLYIDYIAPRDGYAARLLEELLAEVERLEKKVSEQAEYANGLQTDTDERAEAWKRAAELLELSDCPPLCKKHGCTWDPCKVSEGKRLIKAARALEDGA